MTQENENTNELLPMDIGLWEPGKAVEAHRKILVYGGSGTGKTTLAATFPAPLFMDLEGGMASIRNSKVLRWPADPNQKVTNFSQINQFYRIAKKELNKPSPRFQTVVIDSLNELQVIVVNRVIEDYPNAAKRLYDDQPTQSDYGKALRDFMKVFRLLLNLPCNVVFLAVEKLRQYEDDKAVPDFVGKKIAPEVLRLVGGIGYTFTTLTNEGGRDRVLYQVSFEDTPNHTGKDRYGIPPGPKPNNFEAIYGKPSAK